MKGDRSKTFLITISAIVILLIYLFPVIWMVATSFRFDQDAWSYPPKVFSKFTLSQYINLFKTRPIGMYFRNSFSVTTISVLFSMALGIPAAFALALCKVLGMATKPSTQRPQPMHLMPSITALPSIMRMALTGHTSCFSCLGIISCLPMTSRIFYFW